MPTKKPKTSKQSNKQLEQESKQGKSTASDFYIPAQFAEAVLGVIEDTLSAYAVAHKVKIKQ